MLFRRRPREEAALEARSPPGHGPLSAGEGEALLRDELGLHRLWYLELRLREELARGARSTGSTFSIATWRPRLLPDETLPGETVRQAAEFIIKSLRSYDVVARIDDERFAAILFDAGFESACTVAFRIKGDLKIRVPSAGKWQAGVATFGRDGLDGDSLIQTALRRLEEDALA